MTNLKSTIESLATEFAMNILGALRAASIDELTGVGASAARPRGRAAGSPSDARIAPVAKRGRGGRLGRRSTEDIGRMVENIVGLLQKNPSGMRAEQIRDALGVQAKELPRPLADGLADGRLTKSGQKRATTYFASGSGGSSSKKTARGGRRAKR